MYIVIYKYTKPLEEVDLVRQSHIDHYASYREQNKMLCGGRLTSKTGGTYILRNLSCQEVDEHVKNDPYVLENVADAEIYEFVPTFFCKELTE